MTTMEEFVAGIVSDGRSQAAKIDEETQEQVHRTAIETANMVAKEQARLQAIAKQQEEELTQRMNAKHKLSAQQKMLATKQELIDEAFVAAQETLSKMPTAKRKKILELLLAKAGKELRVASVITTQKDAPFFKGKKVKITTQEGIGGFVAQSPDGTVRIDLRFETLLRDQRERNMAAISEALFGKTKSVKQS